MSVNLFKFMSAATVVTISLVSSLSFVTVASAQDQCPNAKCTSGKVCRESETFLPLRALPRPKSNIYNAQEATSDKILAENVQAFYPLYVFGCEKLDLSDPANPQGWYEVGSDLKGTVKGWMQAKDVMEWRQALIVAYTHPGTGEEERQRVLMFNDLSSIEAVVNADDSAQQAMVLYGEIKNGKKPDAVVSIEPESFSDIDKSFYVLPVLDFRQIDNFDEDVRLLQIAAAVPDQRSDASTETTLENKVYAQEALSELKVTAENIADITFDIVFVMDTTGSMGPYIEKTKNAVQSIVNRIASDKDVGSAVNFGIVGYRDNVQMMPQLEFTAKNFTSNLLPGNQFVALVEQEVKPASVGSEDYAEEVYAGIEQALVETNWRGGLRFIVLIGDASAHDNNHPQSTTGLDAKTMRGLVDQANAFLLAVHLHDARASGDHPIAEQQYRNLATNPGVENATYFPVDVSDPSAFDSVINQVVNEITTAMVQVKQDGIDKNTINKIAAGQLADPNTSQQSSATAQNSQLIGSTVAAALVNYMDGKPVRDITFWAMDRDLTDPRKKSLDVRLLVSRKELSDLIQTLEVIVEAISTAEITQMGFFEALQAVVAGVTKDAPANNQENQEGLSEENVLADAAKLAENRLLPKWIESLPYRSEILDMSDEGFEALTTSERAALETSLKAKLTYYREISENVDAWHQLQEGAENDEFVFPLPLTQLP